MYALKKRPIAKTKLKKLSLLSTLLTSVLWMSTSTAAEEKILNVYHWSDYMAPDTISNFEKETGIKVRLDLFDNNEIVHAKLVAGKTGYDIVVPSLEWAKLQMDAGIYQKLDKSKLPNLKNLNPQIQQQLAKMDPGNEHLVDWMWGYTTLGINVDKVKAALGDLPMPENTWDLMFNPKYVSKLKSCGVSILDAPSEVLPAALHYLGKDHNSKDPKDYEAAGKLLKSIRPYITVFSASSYINDLADGGLCLAHGWSGDISIARQRAIEAKNGNKIQTLIPKTGAPLMIDTMAIPKDAKHPNNAHLFINYILRPKVAADLTNAVFYANPNKESLPFVDKNVANDKTVFLSDEDLKKMFVLGALSNDMRRLSTRTFNQFKSGR